MDEEANEKRSMARTESECQGVPSREALENPHLTAHLTTVKPLASLLKSGLSNAMCVQLISFVLSHLPFTHGVGAKFRITTLFFLQGPLSGLEVSEIWRDFRQWFLYDGPYPPSIVNQKHRFMITFYLVLYFTVICNLIEFLQICIVVLAPVKMLLFYCFTLWFFYPDMARYRATRIAERFLVSQKFYQIFVVVTAYVISSRWYWYTVHALLLTGEAIHIWVPMTLTPTIAVTISRIAAVLPGMLVVFPFICLILLIQRFWQTLTIPYYWAIYRSTRLWYDFMQADSVQRGQEDYKHGPLEPGEIRLLEVHRSFEGELVIDIRHVQLEEAAAYDAISYTWGSSELNHGIFIDGKWMKITPNAYAVLQDRASMFKSNLLWMDCICINQADNEEKGSQVALMSEIYRKAARVIVWLGHSYDGALAMSLLSDVYKLPTSVKGLKTRRSQMLDIFARFDPRYAALARLLVHDYFFRVWIRQEVVFGNIVHVRHSGYWMDWMHFSRAIHHFADTEYRDLVGVTELARHLQEPNGIREVCALSTLKHQRYLNETKGVGKPRLCDLLVDIQFTKATDPRDMIYGFLSLAREASIPAFAPDYTIDAPEVYIKFAHFFWHWNQLFDIMYKAGVGYPRKLEGLPSWLPDWSSTPVIRSLRRVNHGSFYNASKGRSRQIKPVTSRFLCLEGAYLDKITMMMPESFDPSVGSNQDEKIQAVIASMLSDIEVSNLVSGLPEVYLNGQSRDEALWRTLIGDTMVGTIGHGEGHVVDTSHTPHGCDSTFRRPAIDSYGKLYHLTAMHHEILRWACISKNDSWKMVRSKIRTALKTPELKCKFEAALAAEKLLKLDHRWTDAFRACASGRKLAVTEKGYMAMIPPLSEVGDDIGILYGADVPFVFRKCEEPDHGNLDVFELVGECYVHGVMDGEALENESATDMYFYLH